MKEYHCQFLGSPCPAQMMQRCRGGVLFSTRPDMSRFQVCFESSQSIDCQVDGQSNSDGTGPFFLPESLQPKGECWFLSSLHYPDNKYLSVDWSRLVPVPRRGKMMTQRCSLPIQKSILRMTLTKFVLVGARILRHSIIVYNSSPLRGCCGSNNGRPSSAGKRLNPGDDEMTKGLRAMKNSYLHMEWIPTSSWWTVSCIPLPSNRKIWFKLERSMSQAWIQSASWRLMALHVSNDFWARL